MNTDRNKATAPMLMPKNLKSHKSSKHRTLGAFVGITATLLILATVFLGAAQAASAPSLGTAVNFAVLGGSTVTNTGATIVNGNLGVSPGTAITGFPPGVVVPPATTHASDAVALQAQSDVTTAYNNLAGQACNVNLAGQDLGGLTLTAGVYCFPSTTAQLTGALTLDAQNNANAVFIFQIGSTLTTASSSSVKIIHGGAACRIFWQVGSSATLGTNTAFKGNILANASITANTSASISSGRALARSGAVAMDTNSITTAGCAAQPTPTPLAATQTVIAATQTAVAPTLTAIAATQTAVAPTQTHTATPTRTATPTKTALPATQTVVAMTPTLVPAGPDVIPPTGHLSGTGTDSLGNKFMQMAAQDNGSGMASIVVLKTTNAVTVVAGFIPGTNQPVIITSTKINPGQGSTVALRITDVAGNVTIADPVLTLLALTDGTQVKQTFKGIPVGEHFISVSNSKAGLKRMQVLVNGAQFTLKNLKRNEIRTLDVSSAMTQNANKITLIGFGASGASAFVIIGDSAVEQPAALQGFAQHPNGNLTWGEVDGSQ